MSTSSASPITPLSTFIPHAYITNIVLLLNCTLSQLCQGQINARLVESAANTRRNVYYSLWREIYTKEIDTVKHR